MKFWLDHSQIASSGPDQGAVHTNQNTPGTTVWVKYVVRNVIKCDIAMLMSFGMMLASLGKYQFDEVIFPA